MASGLEGLAEPLRGRIEELLRLAGGRVTIVSGLRSRDQQIALRRKHCGTSYYDIFEKPASQCSPPTARPGSSKHETGQAVDLGGDLKLAAELGRQLGLATPVAGEPWHFELSKSAQGIGGNRVVQGVTGGIVGLGGDIVSAAVDPLLEGLKKVLVTGAFLAGGVALLVAGGYRSTTGRSITSDTAGAVGTGVQLAATGGTGAAAKSAKASTAVKAAATKKAPGGKTP